MVEKIKKLIFLFKKFIKGLPLSAKILLGFLTIILFFTDKIRAKYQSLSADWFN